MNVKIIADSSSDILNIDYENYESAPLKIITSEKEFTDDINLNVEEMVEFLKGYKYIHLKAYQICFFPSDL